MNTKAINPREYLLSNHPYPVTVADARSWIARKDDDSKEKLVELIYHRLHHRYIEPLHHVVDDYKSGFLIMAVSCLLIETLQSFYEGLPDTKGIGGQSFEDFFKREAAFFPGFVDGDVDFYGNIRCGILHQAETKGGYRIWRAPNGTLLDKGKKTIDANEFLKALENCLKNYIKKLKESRFEDIRWQKAIDKINFICDNCNHPI